MSGVWLETPLLLQRHTAYFYHHGGPLLLLAAASAFPPRTNRSRPATTRTFLTATTSAKADPITWTETRMLGWSTEQLFSLVSNVEDYVSFVPWCKTSSVTSALVEKEHSTGRPGTVGDTGVASDVLNYVPSGRQRARLGTKERGMRNGMGVKYEAEFFKDRTVLLLATLGVGFGPLREQYVSKVTCEWPHSVVAIASQSSLFKRLETRWTFTPGGSNPADVSHPTSLVTFFIDFEFRTNFYAQVANMFMQRVSHDMIAAFEKKALKTFGPGKARPEFYE